MNRKLIHIYHAELLGKKVILNSNYTINDLI